MRKLHIGFCIALCYTASLALVSAYHTEPRTAGQSGWTKAHVPGQQDVSQVVTINFDELDSAAGGCYVELFTGGKCRGLGYALSVVTYPGGTPIAYTPIANSDVDHGWVKFKLNILHPDSIVRGKKLKFTFTRVWPDSLQFYYDTTAGYSRYGQMIAPSLPSLPATAGLAMRVYGRLNPIDSTYFGADECSWSTLPDTGNFDPWMFADSTRSAHVGTVRLDIDWWKIQEGGPESWNFSLFDSSMRALDRTAGCRILGLLTQPPEWAVTRRDTNCWGDSEPRWSPPRCLDYSVEHDSNYLARFLDELLTHCADSGFEIHDWEVLNEVNHEDTWPGSASVWQHPNLYYTGALYVGPDIHPMCSLYVRYAVVVDSAIRTHPDHDTDRMAVNSVNWINTDQTRGFSGKAWLREFYGVVEECNLPRFWDAISAHPYQENIPVLGAGWPFEPRQMEAHAETLRSIMREHDDHGELWNTEFSLPGFCWWVDDTSQYWRYTVTTEEQDADYCCETFSSAEGLKALPGGCFDRTYWWLLRQRPGEGSWGLMDSFGNVHAGLYAFKQTAEQLTGKRFNKSVGGTSTNGRIYEFEDTTTLRRTWVCWQGEAVPAYTPVPARNDVVDTVALAYDGSPPADEKDAENSGWLHLGLDQRPVFVTETGTESRPELAADSIWTAPDQLHPGWLAAINLRIKNRDAQRSTPAGCSTWVRFWWDDSVIGTAYTTQVLGPSALDTVTLLTTVPNWMQGNGLLKADANPGMLYVEKEGTDDNQAHMRLNVRVNPTGGFNAVVPSSGKTGALLLPMGMTSRSWESDTTGAQNADSARILFVWYGQKDTVVHATDTTAWFPFCSDTTLLFPRGCGTFRVYAQFRDSGQNDSPFYPDSTDSIIVFDSVPPTGSVVLNSGDRFATSSTCTLALAANDSASGVWSMKFLNVPKVDLVVGGSFTATAGSWVFTNGEVDTLLHMARLTVTPVEAMVRQFIPAESISAHVGDSCALEASVLAHVHEDSATGSVSFWYYSARVDSLNFHDTLWQLVDSARFSGNLLSLTGRYSLSKRFLLSPPSSDSEWVWKGGMVRVEAVAENGNGSVWTDDVRLIPYEPDSGHFWRSFDTLALWDIGSGAGQHVVRMCLMDSAGVENATPCCDTIILDPTAPVVDISQPGTSQLVNGVVEITGVAYDTIEVPGDTWFQRRTLSYRRSDSTNWLPVLPDSCSHVPAYPDSQQILGPAVHLGYWNTLSVPNGQYYLKLTATDSAGHVSSCSTWVMVFHGGGGGMGNGPEGGGSGMGEGSVYVGSADGTVLHLSDALDSLDAYSVSDSGSQAKVTAILEVGDDSLLVLDAANRRIHKLHKSGQHRRRLVSNLSQPVDLKRDDNGNLWLADRGWNRIGKFRSNGTLVFVRGGLGADSLHFDAPEGIAVKGSLVYVADGGNDRICVWDTSGNYKATVTGDFENPTAVYVTDEGTIYLTDGSDGKLKGITPLGGSIVALGTEDSSKLKGLVPSENRHSLFSLASVPNKVYKLRIMSDDNLPGGQQSAGKVNLPRTLSLAQPFPNPARTRLNIAYALPRQTRVVLKLYDVAGKLVKTLANGEQKPGYHNLTWNRQDAKGRSCACGVYFCTLTAENQRFSRKVILTE